MSSRHAWHVAFAAVLLGLSCTRAADETNSALGIDELRAVSVPADTGSLAPYLAATEDGDVYLSWIGRDAAGGRAVYVARGRGGRFGTPAAITSGDSLFVNWADTPGVLPYGEGRVVAWWLVRQNDEGAYHVRIAVSQDRGATWSSPRSLHEDATLTEHGFVSAAAQGDHAVLTWLDGNKYAASSHHHDAPDPNAATEVRTALVGGDGTVREERIVDDRACDCCPTASIAVDGSILVAYRDRTREEVRDVVLARYDQGAWSAPEVANADGWVIPGCPVNGPALDARGGHVGLAWFTASGDSARVLAALSEDGGRAFGAPGRIDEGRPAGRVDVELLGDGSALIAWIETAPDTAYLLLRRMSKEGRSPRRTVAHVSASRRSGVPRLASAGGYLYVVWTEVGPPSRVRLARARLVRIEGKDRTARGNARGSEG